METLKNRVERIKKTYHEFPAKFWSLVAVTFIDRIGGTLIFPFFALYVTQQFNVGMTEAGVLLGIFSVSGLVGSMLGGALADKLGRKCMVLFGLICSALSSLSMGFVADLYVFYALGVVVGILSDIAGPAREAMIADMLPEDKRADGFGIMRVFGNLAWIIGPSIGGFVAARSYLVLFILDAVISLFTASLVYRLIPETKPEEVAEQGRQTLWDTVAGYRLVARDGLFVAFVIASMLMLLVYQQLYSTASVFMRDVHGISTRGYGFLMSVNAGAVVLFQFWVTRKIKPYPPMLMMAIGTVFYLVGFTMYGFISAYWLFLLATFIITVGEMVVVPVSQALAARFAPADMRGRYMAFYSLSWTIPATVGPWAAGLIMDNYDPNWVWYAGGIILAMAVAGFGLLHLRTAMQPSVEAAEKQRAAVVI